ncbi:MAG: hypothetical protein JSW08_01245 [archaeon]|nr:MAG: hypothetical protein JSW08_01245 [archaeon]
MNKKAITFGITLVVVVLIAIGTSTYFFVRSREKVLQNTVTGDSILEFQEEIMKLKLYTEESVKLAASQTLYELALRSFVNEQSCLVYRDRIVWGEDCNPSYLEERFLKKFEENFLLLMKEYPGDLEDYSYELKNNILIIKSSDIEKKVVADTNYSFIYSLDNLAEVDLMVIGINITEIENMFGEVSQIKQQCSSNINCIKTGLKLENWDFEVSEETGYLIFEMKTKKYHFVNKGGNMYFEKARMEFAI